MKGPNRLPLTVIIIVLTAITPLFAQSPPVSSGQPWRSVEERQTLNRRISSPSYGAETNNIDPTGCQYVRCES